IRYSYFDQIGHPQDFAPQPSISRMTGMLGVAGQWPGEPAAVVPTRQALRVDRTDEPGVPEPHSPAQPAKHKGGAMRLMLAMFLLSGCAPKRNVPSSEVPKLTKLDDVMDVQATVADPQFKKIGQASYGDTDFAAFADRADRIVATTAKLKDFSKGPG